MSGNEPPATVFFGGGGHAKVLIDALTAQDDLPPAIILDADRTLWQTKLQGVPVVGGFDQLDELVAQGLTDFVVAIGSTKSTAAKTRLFELGCQKRLSPRSVIHPRAHISPTASVGEGFQAMAGSIVGTGAAIESNVLVNSGAIVEHDCVIKSHVHIATGAKLAGAVHIETGAHIGAGAVVLQGVRINSNAVVGAGAVVLEDVPADATVVGVPAKLV